MIDTNEDFESSIICAEKNNTRCRHLYMESNKLGMLCFWQKSGSEKHVRKSEISFKIPIGNI